MKTTNTASSSYTESTSHIDCECSNSASNVIQPDNTKPADTLFTDSHTITVLG